jgi:hypothetical protein
MRRLLVVVLLVVAVIGLLALLVQPAIPVLSEVPAGWQELSSVRVDNITCPGGKSVGTYGLTETDGARAQINWTWYQDGNRVFIAPCGGTDPHIAGTFRVRKIADKIRYFIELDR